MMYEQIKLYAVAASKLKKTIQNLNIICQQIVK